MSLPEYISSETRQVKHSTTWRSPRLNMDITLVRYGFHGIPLLLYPTAGGDAEEPERFYLIRGLEPFIREGRLKVYCVDSINGRTWLTNSHVPHAVWVQKQFDSCVREEVVPAIRRDCRTDSIEIMTAGASIGAFNALLSICRHPDIFSRALCMSGTYDLQKWLQGQWFEDFYHQSPLHFIPNLPDDDRLQHLRRRNVLIVTGKGKNEDPGQTWKVAHALGSKGVPNRVDLWDEDWPHDWVTWREMTPKYIQEMLTSLGS
jgi:esterase/lipase superfamily enzyme